MAGRVSQDVVEVEAEGSPNARVSQEVVEAEVVATPQARVSQEVLEALADATPEARVSQIVLEANTLGTPNARVSQIVLELLVVNIEVLMPPIFPTLIGLGYNVKWTPAFFNMATETTATGADIDLGLSQYPLHDFELIYNFLRDQFGDTEFKTMMGFWLRLGGTLGRFLFKNPDDAKVTAQALTTTDGSSAEYGPLVRTYGIGENTGTEPVGYVDVTEPFNLYLDGVLQPADSYVVLTTEPCLQMIRFNSTPTIGQVITVDMSYFYYCKFPDNANTFEKFLDRIWTLQKITLHSCRAGA